MPVGVRIGAGERRSVGAIQLQPWAIDETNDLVSTYREQGYAIVRGLFSRAEVAAIGAAIDVVEADAAAHGRSFRHGNLAYRLVDGDVRMAQWPSWAHPALDAVRLDPRFVELLAP